MGLDPLAENCSRQRTDRSSQSKDWRMEHPSVSRDHPLVQPFQME
jgi:hypothetical protein